MQRHFYARMLTNALGVFTMCDDGQEYIMSWECRDIFYAPYVNKSTQGVFSQCVIMGKSVYNQLEVQRHFSCHVCEHMIHSKGVFALCVMMANSVVTSINLVNYWHLCIWPQPLNVPSLHSNSKHRHYYYYRCPNKWCLVTSSESWIDWLAENICMTVTLIWSISTDY